jgi:hypothetical protein
MTRAYIGPALARLAAAEAAVPEYAALHRGHAATAQRRRATS